MASSLLATGRDWGMVEARDAPRCHAQTVKMSGGPRRCSFDVMPTSLVGIPTTSPCSGTDVSRANQSRTWLEHAGGLAFSSGQSLATAASPTPPMLDPPRSGWDVYRLRENFVLDQVSKSTSSPRLTLWDELQKLAA